MRLILAGPQRRSARSIAGTFAFASSMTRRRDTPRRSGRSWYTNSGARVTGRLLSRVGAGGRWEPPYGLFFLGKHQSINVGERSHLAFTRSVVSGAVGD